MPCIRPHSLRSCSAHQSSSAVSHGWPHAPRPGQAHITSGLAPQCLASASSSRWSQCFSQNVSGHCLRPSKTWTSGNLHALSASSPHVACRAGRPACRSHTAAPQVDVRCLQGGCKRRTGLVVIKCARMIYSLLGVLWTMRAADHSLCVHAVSFTSAEAPCEGGLAPCAACTHLTR